MNEVMKRLYEAAKEIKGITGQSALGKLLNASPQTVKNWETRGVSKQGLIKASQILGISLTWLETGSGNPTLESNAKITGSFEPWDDNTPLIDDDIEIPLYKEIQFSAGNGTFEQEDHNGNKLRFSARTLRRYGIQPHNAVCVSITGNSMEPVLPDGAVIGIDLGDTQIRDGKIYAINYGGVLMAKVLQKQPYNKVLIKSYNSIEYPDKETDMEEISIIGRVFWWSVLD